MRDLVSITNNRDLLLRTGFRMMSEDDPTEVNNDDSYRSDSVSEYILRISKLEEKKYGYQKFS